MKEEELTDEVNWKIEERRNIKKCRKAKEEEGINEGRKHKQKNKNKKKRMKEEKLMNEVKRIIEERENVEKCRKEAKKGDERNY